MIGQTPVNGIKDAAQDAAEEMTGAITETAQMLKGVAVDAGSRAQELAREAGGKAQEFAREAGRQAGAAAGAAAQTIYGTSNEVLDVVEGVIRQNPWGALLIAGAAGYGLACLIKSR